jgi:hypothetical protein
MKRKLVANARAARRQHPTLVGWSADVAGCSADGHNPNLPKSRATVIAGRHIAIGRVAIVCLLGRRATTRSERGTIVTRRPHRAWRLAASLLVMTLGCRYGHHPPAPEPPPLQSLPCARSAKLASCNRRLTRVDRSEMHADFPLGWMLSYFESPAVAKHLLRPDSVIMVSRL